MDKRFFWITAVKQSKWMHGVASKEEVVRSGIPQWSVLGPMLFVIYINDLPEHVISQMYLFADDTKLMKKVRTQNDSVLLQNDMDGMQNWSNTWLLNFHPDKCHVLTLGKLQNIKHAHNYRLGDTELEHVISTKKTLAWLSIPIYRLKTTLQKRFAKPIPLLDLFIGASTI